MRKPLQTTKSGGQGTHGSALKSIGYGLLALILASCADQPAAPRSAPPAQASAVADPGAIPDDYVATPAGLYHRSCVHEIPMGATVGRDRVVRRRDGSTYRLPTCSFAPRPTVPGHAQLPGSTPFGGAVSAPTINGWVEYTWANAGPYKRIVADWQVPSAPPGTYGAAGKVYYTFPGLQSNDYIIQPVLQYGNNGLYGGAYWTITSWRCNTGSDCVHSPPVTVSSGNVIHGDVSASNCSGGVCTWTITTTNSSTGQSTTHTVQDTENYWQATSGAVEVYGVNSCADYPRNNDYNQSGVFYTNVSVYDNAYSPVSPSWSAIITSGLNPQCNYRVTYSATTANLYHAPNFTASISGPSSIARYQSAQYTATALFGASPLSYQWRVRHSPDGFSWGAWSSWYSTGSQNYTYTSVNSCGIRRANLQVMVTDALSRTATADYYISVSNPC